MKRKTQEIRHVILQEVFRHHRVPTAEIARQFGVTRQAIGKNVRALVKERVMTPCGSARKRKFDLKTLWRRDISLRITPGIEENEIWTKQIAPHLGDLKENVREICHYGFTEMFNNVIDHSQSEIAEVVISKDALTVGMIIKDYGIGIWKKLVEQFKLADARHALLELSKGKLTTDPKRHTGEGIFFTSRMFDHFVLASDRLSFCRFEEGHEWLFDVKEEKFGEGTQVVLRIQLNSERIAKEVFEEFASDYNDFGFTRTQLSVELATYEGDHLVSRSQAKRLVSRLEQFKEVYLDFRGVTDIGQAFADEIFRVFRNDHPQVHLIPIHVTPAIQRMIDRATSAPTDEDTASSLFP